MGGRANEKPGKPEKVIATRGGSRGEARMAPTTASHDGRDNQGKNEDDGDNAVAATRENREIPPFSACGFCWIMFCSAHFTWGIDFNSTPVQMSGQRSQSYSNYSEAVSG